MNGILYCNVYVCIWCADDACDSFAKIVFLTNIHADKLVCRQQFHVHAQFLAGIRWRERETEMVCLHSSYPNVICWIECNLINVLMTNLLRFFSVFFSLSFGSLRIWVGLARYWMLNLSSALDLDVFCDFFFAHAAAAADDAVVILLPWWSSFNFYFHHFFHSFSIPYWFTTKCVYFHTLFLIFAI